MKHSDVYLLAQSEGRETLGTLADGTPVFQKLGPNHLANHPDVVALLSEALGKLSMDDFDGNDLSQVVPMGRQVGVSTCVENTAADEIVFGRRAGRKFGCTRFVKNRQALPCSSVVVRLYKNKDGLVALMTAFISNVDTPAEPSSKSAKRNHAACVSFWENHALILGDDEALEPGDFTAEDFNREAD